VTGPRVLAETSYFPVALDCGVVCALRSREINVRSVARAPATPLVTATFDRRFIIPPMKPIPRRQGIEQGIFPNSVFLPNLLRQ
jgi:hypothetical protein